MADYSVTPADQTAIAALYAAFWNRAPDTTGFGYWCDILASGKATVDEIATTMRNLPEGEAAYPFWSTNVQLVTEVYENVFGRTPDAGGLVFWTAALDQGRATFPQLVVDMIEAAQGNTDGVLFDNKVQVGIYVATVAQTDNNYVTSNAFNLVGYTQESVVAAEAWVDANNTGATYTLTTNIDTINVEGQAVNTVVGVQQHTNGTWNTGDTINGNNKTNINLILNDTAGDTASIVDANNIASVNVNLAASSGLNELEFTNVAAVNVTNGTGSTTLTVTNAALSTVHGLATSGRAMTETITYASTSGAADVAALSVGGTGTSKADSTFNVANSNGIEGVTLATSGTNYVTVNAGTGAAAITVTGNGANDLTIGSAAATMLLDASATTGDNLFDMGTHLVGVSDTIKGGSGEDMVVADISNTTASTITGVEALDLNFTTGALFNALNVTDVNTLFVANTGAATFSNLASSVDLVAFDTTAAGAGATLGFASKTANALEVDVGLVTDLGTSTQAVGVGNLTISGNAGTVTIDSLSDKATTTNTIGALNVGTATALTVNAASAALTVGAVTASKITTLDVEAAAAGITLGGVADASALTTLTANATKGNVALGTVKTTSALTSVIVSAAADAATATDRTLSLTIDNKADASATSTSLTVSGEGDVTVASGTTGTTSAVRAFVGSVDATAATGSVTLNFGDYEGAGNFSIALGNAATGEANFVDITGATGAALVTGGTGADTVLTGDGADIVNTGAGNDYVFGGAGDDVINTDAGNDTIQGGAGADLINGGTGTNTAEYIGSSAAVTVNLTNGVNTGGDAAGDILTNIQNLTGSAYSDSLTGNTSANLIDGAAGADAIFGVAGNNTLVGGTGADVITAGTGVDTFGTANNFGAQGQSVIASASTFTAGGVTAGETITFATGAANTVDYISGFGAADLLDVVTAGSIGTAIVGNAVGATTAGTTYYAYGTYNATTGVFTTAAAFNATTAKDAIVFVGDGTATQVSTTGYVVLDDLSAALVTGNFI